METPRVSANRRPRAVLINDSGRVIGQDHPRSTLTDHEVDLIVELRNDHGMKLRELAEKFEISISAVVHYAKGRRRSQVATGQRLPGAPRDRCQSRPARAGEFDDCT